MAWAFYSDPQEAPPLPLLIVLFGITVGCIVGTLKVLLERIEEIGKEKKMLIVTINEVPGKSWKRWAWCAQHGAEPQSGPRSDGGVPHAGGR